MMGAKRSKPGAPTAGKTKSSSSSRVKRGGLTKRGRQKLPPREPGTRHARRVQPAGTWKLVVEPTLKRHMQFFPAGS